jgi:hypothetical protein
MQRTWTVAAQSLEMFRRAIPFIALKPISGIKTVLLPHQLVSMHLGDY